MKIKRRNFLVLWGESAGAILLGSVLHQKKLSIPANVRSPTSWGRVLSAEKFPTQVPQVLYDDYILYPSQQAFAVDDGEYGQRNLFGWAGNHTCKFTIERFCEDS